MLIICLIKTISSERFGQLNYNFKDYYDELTDNWNFNDDRDGNWTIITDETTYHFNLQNGKWLMSDDNGNVIDSFIPFSTLTEDTAEENRNSVITDDGNGTAHRVGENLKIEEDTTVTECEKEKWKIWNKMRDTDSEYALAMKNADTAKVWQLENLFELQAEEIAIQTCLVM